MNQEPPQYRTQARLIDHWRNEARWKAYGFIAAAAAQTVSNRQLAKVLEMDPRGLRQVIQQDPHFVIEIRTNIEEGRGEPWYSLNPDIKHGSAEPPRLIRIVASKAHLTPLPAAYLNSPEVALNTKEVESNIHA